MVFFRFLVIFFITINVYNQAFADSKTRVIDWQEQITLTDDGKKGQVTVEMQVINLPKNYQINSYQISSSSQNLIEFSQVMIDGVKAQFVQNTNSLQVKFNEAKRNQEFFKISYSYHEKYTKLYHELRQEAVYVPSFANRANYKIIFNYPTKYDLLTNHYQAGKSKNDQMASLVFQGNASPEGFLEKIRLTTASAKWQATVRNIITLNNLKGSLEAKTPILFRDGPQLIEKQELTSSFASKDRGTDKRNIFFKFNVDETVDKIIIENRASVITGKKNQNNFQRNPLNYKDFTKEEESHVIGLVDRVKKDPIYKNLALYSALTMFVNSYIKYDLSYYGKEPALEQIVENPQGVCSEYARLLNAMARVAGIPAITVNGLAVNDKGEFEAHAWNALYVDGGWVFVDPTWGLANGNVSSSHIYLRDEGNKDIELKFFGNKDAKLDADFEFVVEKIID
jgi:hypothetical protein